MTVPPQNTTYPPAMAAAADFPDLAAIQAWLDLALNHERAGTFRDIRLDRFRSFLSQLFASTAAKPPAPVTVAGTKGKGSTVRLLEAILVAHGKPVLAFTSPHVATINERWRLDGIPATAAHLAPHAATVANLEATTGTPLTWFERTFAIAVLLANSRPDTIFLCEVGLGGRLDCANALDADLAIITHLSHDHRDVLGPTLTHIAREKLAIARSGKALLIAPQSKAATAALRSVVSEAELPMGLTKPGPFMIWSPASERIRDALSEKSPEWAMTKLFELLEVEPTALVLHDHLLVLAYAKAGSVRPLPASAMQPSDPSAPADHLRRALRLLAEHPHPATILAAAEAASRLAVTAPGMADVALLYHAEYRRLVAKTALHGPLIPTWITAPGTPFQLALPGAHQQDNAATALTAAHLLVPNLDEARARAAMADTRLAARCQLIAHGKQRILIDGAHNGPSIAATLAVAAQSLRPNWKLILGTATDKEIDEILAIIPPGIHVTRCAYDSSRARQQSDWPTSAQAWPWFDDITHALAANTDSDLCITGSFYLAGEALTALGHAGDLPG